MTQNLKSYVCLAAILIAYGIVGEMDYRTQAHIAGIEVAARNA